MKTVAITILVLFVAVIWGSCRLRAMVAETRLGTLHTLTNQVIDEASR